jgi:hypothetical protein
MVSDSVIRSNPLIGLPGRITIYQMVYKDAGLYKYEIQTLPESKGRGYWTD